MNGRPQEKKRWRFARMAVWTGILGGTLLFWSAAGLGLVAWWR